MTINSRGEEWDWEDGKAVLKTWIPSTDKELGDDVGFFESGIQARLQKRIELADDYNRLPFCWLEAI